jgi:hypothetical protein
MSLFELKSYVYYTWVQLLYGVDPKSKDAPDWSAYRNGFNNSN